MVYNHYGVVQSVNIKILITIHQITMCIHTPFNPDNILELQAYIIHHLEGCHQLSWDLHATVTIAIVLGLSL